MNLSLSILPLLVSAMLLVARESCAEVSVRDDYERTVRLAAPAGRIVSLAPHLTELAYSAGAGTRLAGADEYSDYPPEAKMLPRIGSESGIRIESVLALKPDLVIAWPNAGSARAIDRIESLGIVVYRSEPRSFEDIARTIERLGTLAATETMARASAEAFRRRIRVLESTYSRRPAVTVFYQVWDRPIVTVTGAHLISRVIDLCGGRNVFADAPGLAPQVDREAVLAAAPELIAASGRDAARPPWLDGWKRFPRLPAVQSGNLVSIDPDLIQRHTTRVASGAEQLCRLLEGARSTRGDAVRPGASGRSPPPLR